jgi:hypothetical protein
LSHGKGQMRQVETVKIDELFLWGRGWSLEEGRDRPECAGLTFRLRGVRPRMMGLDSGGVGSFSNDPYVWIRGRVWDSGGVGSFSNDPPTFGFEDGFGTRAVIGSFSSDPSFGFEGGFGTRAVLGRFPTTPTFGFEDAFGTRAVLGRFPTTRRFGFEGGFGFGRCWVVFQRPLRLDSRTCHFERARRVGACECG